MPATSTRANTMQRLRFGVFLLLAVFVAVQLGDSASAWTPHAANGAWSATRMSYVVEGDAHVSTFEIRGTGYVSDGAFVKNTVLACNPCSVRMHVETADVRVTGGGTVRGLEDDTGYRVANFHGTIGIVEHGRFDYTLTFDGGADAVREVNDDYPY